MTAATWWSLIYLTRITHPPLRLALLAVGIRFGRRAPLPRSPLTAATLARTVSL